MAPLGRARPVSAETITSAAAESSATSCFADLPFLQNNQFKPGERPLPELLNMLVDAAHYSHDNRKLQLPPTHAYSVFTWRVAEARLTAGSTQRSAGGTTTTTSVSCGGTRSGTSSGAPSATLAPTSTAPAAPVPPHAGSGSAAAAAPPLDPIAEVPAGRQQAEEAGGRARGAVAAPASASATTGRCVSPVAGGAGGGCGGGGGSCGEGRRNLSPSASTAGAGGMGNGVLAGVGRGGAAGSSGGGGWGRGAGSCGGGGGGGGSCAPSVGRRSHPASASTVGGSWSAAAWAEPELEVVCLYDGNFQTANSRGRQGPPRRVPAPEHIGPISYLFRWYCKRSTQFLGSPSPADVPDAPAIPPPEPHRPSRTGSGGLAAAATAGSSSGGSTGSSSGGGGGIAGALHTRSVRAASGSSSGSSRGGSSAAATAAAASRAGAPSTSTSSSLPRRPASAGRMGRRTSSSAGGGGSGGGGGSSSGSGGGGSGSTLGLSVGTGSGRRLNSSLDPVMSLSEVTELLEDLEVVPHLASRTDVSQLFHAARQAAHPHPHLHPHLYGDSFQRTSDAAFIAATTTITSSTSGGGSGGSSGPVRVPRAQIHPDEIRFPAFRDFLVRLALAIACAAAANNAATTTNTTTQFLGSSTAVAAAVTGSSPHNGKLSRASSTLTSASVVTAAAAAGPLSTTTPGCSSGSSSRRQRSLSGVEAIAAVRRLLETMELYGDDHRGLKHRLDALARIASDHGARVKANKLLYMSGPSVVAAAAGVAIASVAAPPPAAAASSGSPVVPSAIAGAPPMAVGAAVGTSYGNPPPWSILAAAPAPSYLLAVLAEEDVGDGAAYRPAWREFGAMALELGVLRPGELRQCRMVLINRGVYQISVRLDTSGAPFCTCSYSSLNSLPAGIPRPVDIAVQLTDVGEVVGELRLYYSSRQDPREKEIVVPVYGMVCPPTHAEVVVRGRKVPTTPSERRAMAAKAARDGTATAAATAAAAAAALMAAAATAAVPQTLQYGLKHGTAAARAAPQSRSASSSAAASRPSSGKPPYDTSVRQAWGATMAS
ncbi:hypothetical protein Agub_g9334 [Astrephomene gubernaculifera]|uniref:Uncharacterized protein n=1 Tax=Astrephomene gubernaculifera TaxID=47775 RepID=A0AAD3HN65_9CHLO|nr:hypothetical protein Agub_g9334 [Astrephomene gubernaculifera]